MRRQVMKYSTEDWGVEDGGFHFYKIYNPEPL
jgi:hypothetical protein